MTDFARNRKAFHDFDIEETYEAGIALTGPEVKSVRAGRANLKESYARVRDGEVFLLGPTSRPTGTPRTSPSTPPATASCCCTGRDRPPHGKSQEDGKTLIPLRLYDRKGNIKLELAVASRKRQYDKRREIAR